MFTFRLCDIRFTTVKASFNLDQVALNPQTGDFNPNSLVQQVNKEPINRLVVKSWIDRAGRLYLILAAYSFNDRGFSGSQIHSRLLRQH